MTSRALLTSVTALALSLVAAVPATATGPGAPGPRPTEIALPTGFQPEGIDTGPGAVAYLGSLADGDIYRADLRTGQGRVISQGPGTPSVGVELDRNRLFVAGGSAGDARVVDVRTGEVLASYQLAAAGTPGFVNDVVVTRRAAYFTDSINAVVYELPLGRRGALPTAGQVRAVPLSGDLVYGAGFNANGIETTPDGSALLVVQSSTGLLFRVDPATGVSTAVDLGGATLVNGDGLTRDGRTLYAVQNQLNTLAVLTLAHDGSSATVVQRVTDPRFDVPTTVARSGDRLYLPNARFGIPAPETASYEVISIPVP